MSGLELSELLADVNARVYELAEHLGGGEERWDFRCECGDKDCAADVSLSLSEYRERCDSGRPILAEGHAVRS